MLEIRRFLLQLECKLTVKFVFARNVVRVLSKYSHALFIRFSIIRLFCDPHFCENHPE